MRNPAILHPLFALAAWTFLVLLLSLIHLGDNGVLHRLAAFTLAKVPLPLLRLAGRFHLVEASP